MVVFTDCQCPYCRQFAATARQVLAQHGGAVRIVVWNYPLERIHPAARAAAKAAICGGVAGRFGAMHDRLFAQHDSVGVKPFTVIAAEAGVGDTAWFRACMNGRGAAEALKKDLELAARVGVRGTPTVLVNDRVVPWSPPKSTLDSLIGALVERAR